MAHAYPAAQAEVVEHVVVEVPAWQAQATALFMMQHSAPAMQSVVDSMEQAPPVGCGQLPVSGIEVPVSTKPLPESNGVVPVSSPPEELPVSGFEAVLSPPPVPESPDVSASSP
jgi:hypothetical protein